MVFNRTTLDNISHQLLLSHVCFYLLHTDQGHLLPRHRLLDGYGGHGFEEKHPSLLQSQWAGQGVGMVRSLGSSKYVSWDRARDQAQVLQGEVEDSRAGALKAVGLLDGVWWGSSSSGFVKANAGGCNLLSCGRSGSCQWQNNMVQSLNAIDPHSNLQMVYFTNEFIKNQHATWKLSPALKYTCSWCLVDVICWCGGLVVFSHWILNVFITDEGLMGDWDEVTSRH